jgi:hypothetical protein
MSRDRSRNVAASVHERLKNVGRDTRRDFNLILIRYVLERFLSRLSRSKHRDCFVLKGALLFVAWENAVDRPTRDLDLLSFGDPDITSLEQIFSEICGVEAEPDGLVFDVSTVQGKEIREGAIHDGVRMKFMAYLGNARINLQVDVGFGDAVVPSASLLEYPVLLDHDPPTILAYPPEAVIAEKFHAMISLGMANSRLKDYYDIWRLVESRQFDLSRIVAAVDATFQRRGTEMASHEPEGLTQQYADRWADAWGRLENRFDIEGGLPHLEDVIQRVREFLMPVLTANTAGEVPDMRWSAEMGWQQTAEGN